jgi:hypothetical protein
MVKRCKACQFHSKQIHQPAQELQTIPLTWPFAVWGLDILGVMGMTSGACQGPCYLPAGVLGISMALG